MPADLLEMGRLCLMFLCKFLPVGKGAAESPISERVVGAVREPPALHISMFSAGGEGSLARPIPFEGPVRQLTDKAPVSAGEYLQIGKFPICGMAFVGRKNPWEYPLILASEGVIWEDSPCELGGHIRARIRGEPFASDLHFKERGAWHHSEQRPRLFQCLLWYDGAVPVDPAASKEAVTHHAMGKQKKDDCQDDYKQELSNPERGWLFSFRGRRIRISCHQISLSARSVACPGTAIHMIRHLPCCRSNGIAPPTRRSHGRFHPL